VKHRRYYVTKWFVTIGIVEAPGIPNEGSDYITVKIPGRRLSNSMRLGTDIFEKKSEAEERGRVLLRNEISKTQKYLFRLQNKLVAMEANRGCASLSWSRSRLACSKERRRGLTSGQ
jgi:hypothetical protein